MNDPWHPEEFLPGFRRMKPPSFYRSGPSSPEDRTAAIGAEAKENLSGLTQALDFRCEVKYLYRDGKIPGIVPRTQTPGDKTQGRKLLVVPATSDLVFSVISGTVGSLLDSIFSK